MNRSAARLAAWLLFAAFCVMAEWALLHAAAAREVSVALLAGGGRLPLGAIALALAAMLARLFTRLLVPGLVAQAFLLAILERTRAERASP